VVEHLPSNHEALRSISNAIKKEEEEGKSTLKIDGRAGKLKSEYLP
jgi:hypothetical protein